MAGKKREEFWKEFPYCNINVLPRRPSFTSGGTAMTEYAWFHWNRFNTGVWRRI